jgi:hypothetical protein
VIEKLVAFMIILLAGCRLPQQLFPGPPQTSTDNPLEITSTAHVTTCSTWVGTGRDNALELWEVDSCELSGEDWITHRFYMDWVTHTFYMRQPISDRQAAYDEITHVIALLQDYPPVYHPGGTSAIVAMSWDQELLPPGYTFGYGAWFLYDDAIAAYERGLRGAPLTEELQIELPCD